MEWRGAIVIAGLLLTIALPAAGAPDNDILFADNNAEGSDQFARNLAEGRAALLAKDYKTALSSFLSADGEAFPESPNYELLPVIAWLQFKLGQKMEAGQTEVRAKEVLNVLIGKDKCVERATGWKLETTAPIDAAVMTSVERRMCSVFLDDYLDSKNSKQRNAITTFAGRLHVLLATAPDAAS